MFDFENLDVLAWRVSDLFRQVFAKERQHIGIELLVEGDAVEARRIRADLWTGRGQWGRARGEKGKMSRVRDHMIFVFYRKTAIHCGDHVRRYAVTAKLRRPELDRHFDA